MVQQKIVKLGTVSC